MGAIWILFIPFLVIIYASSEKKIKRLNKRIRRLEKQVKGNQDMSRLLEELKGQSVTDLNAQLVEAKKELFNLRFQNATNQLDNTSRIKEVRKNIARIQTLITEKAKVAE